ncbi:leucyl aminopeptidase (aminopeptidase T) [Halanaerobium sp. MA284_MarDTE_T2]|nr:leucyl aminopeptidase (aminopeptidase T) [Halanaerobium sp. MA284_MarDTE_T2]RCW78938.1 leucyl aminopeptidase (aminopeptidase T) [Halanaerobium sp. DL-01]
MDNAYKKIFSECMKVRKDETVLIITDEKRYKIAKKIFNVGKKFTDKVYLLEMTEKGKDGEELSKYIEDVMTGADVVIAPTSKSISHTDARRNACKAGTRVASMPGITEDILERTLNTDYNKIEELSIKIAEILDDGKYVKLISDKGTDIEFSISNRKGIADTGKITQRGDFGNLPAGEAYTAPVENTADGKLVFDGAIAGIENLDSPVKIEVKKGKILSIEGEKAAQQFENIINNADKNAKCIAELGIGTNDKAVLTSSLLEVEKVLNTVHIAFGDNVTMGGNNNSDLHIDGVIKNPTLIIDGKTIIEDGNLII